MTTLAILPLYHLRPGHFDMEGIQKSKSQDLMLYTQYIAYLKFRL